MDLEMEWEEREGPPWTSRGPSWTSTDLLGTSPDLLALALALALFFSF